MDDQTRQSDPPSTAGRHPASPGQDHLRLIVDQMPAVLWTTDRELVFTSSQGNGLEALGLQPGEVVGMSVFEYVRSDDPDNPIIVAHRRALHGERSSVELELFGNTYDVHMEPLCDAHNQIVGCVGLALDITKRRQAEQALHQRIEAEIIAAKISRRFAGTQWDNVDEAITDGLSRIARFLGAEHAGMALAAAEGDMFHVAYRWDDDSMAPLVVPNDVPEESIRWILAELRSQGYLIIREMDQLPEARTRQAPSDVRTLRSLVWIGMQIDDAIIGGIVLAWRKRPCDVSEEQIAPLLVLADAFANLLHRQTIERHLNENRRMMGALLGNLPGMAYRCENDTDWTMRFISAGCRELTGYAPEDLINNHTVSYNDLIVPEDRQMVWDDVQAAVEKGEPFRLLYRIRDKSGTVKWVWEQGAAVFDQSGTLVALEGFISDISERKRADNERQKFVALVENSSDAVMMATLDGQTLYMNPAGRHLLGLPPDQDIAGVSMTDWFDIPADEEYPEQPFLKARASGHWSGEVAVRNHITGEVVPVRKTLFVVRHAEGDEPLCLAALLHDLRDEKRAETMMLRAKRLESAGQLAGQVAHDFNNLLGPLVAYPSLIRSRVDDPSGIGELLDDMEMAAKRIAEINQELLTLGRRGHYNVQVLDVNQFVLQALHATIIPSHVEVDTQFGTDVQSIIGGGAQLVRALTNMIGNACDAMPNGGRLTIRTSACKLRATELRGRTIPAGRYVRIDVSDSGHGIPADIIEHVFDPFFTTRKTDKGHGSGLGLAVVHSVIEDHEGLIDVESTPGVGTTFSVYLPVADEPLATNAPDPGAVQGNGEWVMIVDDDNLQRRIVERMLKQLNYNVRVASSGEEAVELARTYSSDILILDMQMGGIDGAETLRRIRQLQPQQRAIILSGHAGSDRVAAALSSGASAYLQKPISLTALARGIHTALHGVPVGTTARKTAIPQ